jgi:hypothetical protein
MKTAMQELMEWLDDSIPETIKEKYLEKEKEQIIQAHGLKYYDIGEVTITGENYYNQNYNQNKN